MARHLDLNLLKVFLLLWDERSVSRAAIKANVTQSAMSHALKRLRGMLNDDLFQRSGQQLAPTPVAIGLEPRLRKALRQVEAAIAPVEFDPRASDRRFVIAAGSYTCEILLPAIAAAVKAQAPGASLQVVPNGAELSLQLDSGAVDLALGSFESWGAEVEGISLFREDMIWVARAGHPLGSVVEERRLRSVGRIEVSSAGVSSRYAGAKGAQPRTILRPLDAAITDGPPSSPFNPAEVIVYDNRTAIEMVARTDLVAMLPRRVVARFADTLPIAVIDAGRVPASTSIAMIWSRSNSEMADHVWLRDIVTRCAAEASAAD